MGRRSKREEVGGGASSLPQERYDELKQKNLSLEAKLVRQKEQFELKIIEAIAWENSLSSDFSSLEVRMSKLKDLVEWHRSQVTELKSREVILPTTIDKIWTQIIKSQQQKDAQARIAGKVARALKNKLRKAHPRLGISCQTKWLKPKDFKPEIDVNAKTEASDEVGNQVSRGISEKPKEELQFTQPPRKDDVPDPPFAIAGVQIYPPATEQAQGWSSAEQLRDTFCCQALSAKNYCFVSIQRTTCDAGL